MQSLNAMIRVSDNGDGDIRIEDREGNVVLLNQQEAVLLKRWLDQAGVSCYLDWREEDEEDEE